MEVSASRTAPSFGFRVLPTATVTVFALEFIYAAERDCTCAVQEITL